jgi:hypothetical protein
VQGLSNIIITLTIILSLVGPLAIYSTMTKTGKSKSMSDVVTVFTLIFMFVLFVAPYARKGIVYALSYINITINLYIAVPRVSMMGCTTVNDVQTRSAHFIDKYLFLFIFTNLFLDLVLLLTELTCCSWWFPRIGGHYFWFDVALFLSTSRQ